MVLTFKDHVTNPPQCNRREEIRIHIWSDAIRLTNQLGVLFAEFLRNTGNEYLRRHPSYSRHETSAL
jgi:hypothetical protein